MLDVVAVLKLVEFRLTVDEADYLWEKRYYLLDYPVALPRLLQTVDIWSWASLNEVYSMIREWAPMQPLESLQLLLPAFVDFHMLFENFQPKIELRRTQR
jgi:hypothetical protein